MTSTHLSPPLQIPGRDGYSIHVNDFSLWYGDFQALFNVNIDIKQGLGGILHPPDDVGGNLDRTAAPVIHLELVAGQVPNPKGDFLAAVPGQDPAQTGLAVRAAIGPEQHDRHAFVRLE